MEISLILKNLLLFLSSIFVYVGVVSLSAFFVPHIDKLIRFVFGTGAIIALIAWEFVKATRFAHVFCLPLWLRIIGYIIIGKFIVWPFLCDFVMPIYDPFSIPLISLIVIAATYCIFSSKKTGRPRSIQA